MESLILYLVFSYLFMGAHLISDVLMRKVINKVYDQNDSTKLKIWGLLFAPIVFPVVLGFGLTIIQSHVAIQNIKEKEE